MTKVVEAAVTVEYEGSTWVGEWTKYPTYIGRDGLVAPDRYLVLSAVKYGTLTHISELFPVLSFRDQSAITDLIVTERTSQVKNELSLPENGDLETAMEQILRKVGEGEWVGQMTHNHEFTTYDLARILGVTPREAFDLATGFCEQGKVELVAGDIIVPTAKFYSAVT